MRAANSYSILGQQQAASRWRELGAERQQQLRAEQKATISEQLITSSPSGTLSQQLLPDQSIDPDNYLRQELTPEQGAQQYLQGISSGEQQIDPLVIAPIIDELSFLAGNENFYAAVAKESVVTLAPYLGSSRGPWDQGQNLGRRRMVIILNSLVSDLLPLVQRYSCSPRLNLKNRPTISEIEEAPEINKYIKRLYQRLTPGGQRQAKPGQERANPAIAYQYSGWQAVISPGLDVLSPLAGGGHGYKFPGDQLTAILNHCYRQQDNDYWREYEVEFLQQLQNDFQRLLLRLARLGAGWPSIDDYR